jgi:hypothetical protein
MRSVAYSIRLQALLYWALFLLMAFVALCVTALSIHSVKLSKSLRIVQMAIFTFVCSLEVVGFTYFGLLLVKVCQSLLFVFAHLPDAQAGGGREKTGKIMKVLVVCAFGFGLLGTGNMVVAIPSILDSPQVTMALYSVLLRICELFLVMSLLGVLFQSKDFDSLRKRKSSHPGSSDTRLRSRYARTNCMIVSRKSGTLPVSQLKCICMAFEW